MTGRTLLNKRISQVEEIVEQLFQEQIDPTVTESIETDAEKLNFVADDAALRERWRKIIKLQVLNRYLNLREDEIGTDDEGGLLPVSPGQERELLDKAVEKVGKTNRSLFARMKEESEQDHYDRYLNAISRAYDPHTSYLPPTSKEDLISR